MKREMFYSRKVSTTQYENMSVGYKIEFDDNVASADAIFKECVQFVEDKISQRMHELRR